MKLIVDEASQCSEGLQTQSFPACCVHPSRGMAGTQGQPSDAIQDVPPAIVSCTLWVPCEIQERKTEIVFLPLEKETLCGSRVVKPQAEGSQ